MTRQSALRGILAFLIILFMMPLGHAFVVLLQKNFDGIFLKICVGLLGALGLVCALWGNKLKNEAAQVFIGAFGAILFWGGWVEFIYISYGQSLSVPPLMNGQEVYTKPEYLMMPSALPFAVLTFIFYLYAANTRWQAVIMLRRWLGIHNTTATYGNSVRAFIDLVLLIWYAYLILLIEFDPGLIGIRHPVTLGFSVICLLIGIILFVRSLKSPTWASALRQAIVTVCVMWTFIEVMIKLKLFTEVWIYPERYIAEMSFILLAFVGAILIMIYSNRIRK